MAKQYIDSQKHWEDSVNSDYDKRQQGNKEQYPPEPDWDNMPDDDEGNWQPCNECSQPYACCDFEVCWNKKHGFDPRF